jgi:glutamate/tyrosine decarboxylase-like PLP-dependent enzyme
MKSLLLETAERAAQYLEGIADRRVAPLPDDVARLKALAGPLPELPSDPAEVLALLDDFGSPATVASSGGRYFGFVIGGSLPAALAANWLAGAWDQNAAMQIMSPVAAKLEEIVLAWMVDLLGLPPGSGAGFVTGTTMANFSAMAAARTALLQRTGWNVEEDGLFGAPPIHVVVGDEVHVSLLKALSMLGLGRSRVTRVAADAQGRMRPEALPALDGRTLICVQAGNVNTGAFDPIGEICARAQEACSWVHVDGAFGYWAAVSPHYAPLLAGADAADSWAIDCHKWLNVPYDSAVAIVRRPEYLQAAILNDVVLNQVLVSFGSEQETRRVIASVQSDGTCWCGGTQWHGQAAMRISVSSWTTTDEDVERSVAAMIRLAGLRD